MGGGGGEAVDAADSEGAEAAALVEEMILSHSRDGCLPRSAQRILFFRKAFWRQRVVPLVRAPRSGDSDAEARRSALSAFLSAKGMLPPAAPAAQAASGRASAAAGTSAAPPPLPDGWQALLDTS